ncbi:MAG: HEAT repeat domain-containing protein, partial [Planctomycetaceae bacterium]
MSDPNSSENPAERRRSRTVYAVWLFIGLVFYVLSAGPVTWIVYYWGDGFRYSSRLPAVLETVYAPLNWIAERSPDRVHRLWTQYIEYFYDSAYRADAERWLADGGFVVDAHATSVNADDREPRYGTRTLIEWQVHLKEIDPQSNAHAAEVPGLIALMKSADVPWFTRRQAAFALGRMRSSAPLALPPLIELLKTTPASSKKNDETPPSVWSAQAIALYGPEARAAAPSLIERALDRSRSINERLVAVEALSMIGVAEPAILPALMSILENQENSALLREAAADALAVMGPSAAAAIPALNRALRDPAEAVRLKSVIALGAFGVRSEIALPQLLEGLLFDESLSVRDAVVVTVGKIGEPAVPLLLPLLAQADSEIRIRALGALGGIGRAANSATNQIAASLDDADPAVRIQSVETLAKVAPSDERIPAALVRALSDDDRQHRMRAARELVRRGAAAQPAIEPLRKLETDPRADVRRLADQTRRS